MLPLTFGTGYPFHKTQYKGEKHMNIIKKSREDLSNKELYFLLTDPQIQKMGDLENTEINIKDFVEYEDVSKTTGEIYTVISVSTDLGTFATNSKTFIECFERIVECFGSDFRTIKVFKGTSNKGRKFLQCSYVN